MIPVSTCALCGGDALEPYGFSHWRRGALHFAQVRCVSCGLLISQPRASSDEIARYYADEYYRAHWPDAAKAVADNQALYAVHEYPLMRELWKSWPPPAGGLAVEVGCGYGAFLPMLASDGYRVAGCDLSHDAVRHCRIQGFDVVQGACPVSPSANRQRWSWRST